MQPRTCWMNAGACSGPVESHRGQWLTPIVVTPENDMAVRTKPGDAASACSVSMCIVKASVFEKVVSAFSHNGQIRHGRCSFLKCFSQSRTVVYIARGAGQSGRTHVYGEISSARCFLYRYQLSPSVETRLRSCTSIGPYQCQFQQAGPGNSTDT